ncbi:YcaO-like family protein [Stigmatella sp. ncwal1]|uniref:YcaO-like family protein n=1 Tax=Stigmatella ashevillensis TaxID=2995309 RepID=A0ABT5DJ20_9BACT|nr:YcaO-like family protein [Stigmatella ashevillena]MDC0713640.1 YcaO-like family protein [Stigmatella ashevillena]
MSKLPTSTHKGLFGGTHRLIPPEATVARVRGLLPIMGITRVANVTGLDTIGIPVVMVIRPNARSLSVSQGKGSELASARASGLMEAIELYHAEHITQPLKLATFNELRFTHRMVDVTVLPALSVSQFHGHYRTLWIEGRSLFDEGSTWVPYEMVHMDYTLPLPSGSGSFLMSSSGLASGNHPMEAVNHALCELIERDATTLFRLSGEEARQRRRVDPATVDDPGCRALLAQYARARVEVGIWEITSDVGVAAFSCTIVDSEPEPQRPIGPMGGMGCHPCRAEALSRALTEAAQSRLTVITGARDDVRHMGPQSLEEEFEAARRMRDTLVAMPRTHRFQDAPDFQGGCLEENHAFLLGRLRAAGLGEAVGVDLTRPQFGIPVVRVIVPGLEPLNDIPGYVPGSRARRRLSERAP